MKLLGSRGVINTDMRQSLIIPALIISACLGILPGAATDKDGAQDECYGPPNLLKTMKTPFSGSSLENAARRQEEVRQSIIQPRGDSPLGTISLAPRSKSASLSSRLSLSRKLVPARIYLPERMTIGKSAKFVIKGKAGSKVALAMADRDSGSKPVMGHKVRLGPDRKVVAVGKIPESGILEIYIGTPIEGDLIGQQLFFEAAIWQEEDMRDTAFAETVAANSEIGAKNGVFMAGDLPQKKGIRIVPDSAIPLSQRTQGASLSTGQP